MKIFYWGVILLAGVYFMGQARAAANEEGYLLKENNVLADFGSYQVKISKWGVPEEIIIDGVSLIKDNGLFNQGNYLEGKGDTRVWQGKDEKKGLAPVRIIEKGNTLMLKREGVLGNKQYPGLESYKELITLDPAGKLTFHYEVEFLVGLTYKGKGYVMNLSYLPIDRFKGKGYQWELADGSKKIGVVPLKWTKATNIHITGVKELKFVSSVGLLTISAGKKTVIGLLDTRSWGGHSLRPDIFPNDPWKPKTSIAKGTKREINFTLILPVKGKGKLPVLPLAKE